MTFRVFSRKEDRIAQVFVEGEIDMFTSPNLRETLILFYKPTIRAVVVDLSKVSFMDSSGIATLVEGLKWSRQEKKEFILTGLGQTVVNALSLTKLDNVFSIEPDLRTALAALKGSKT